MTKGIRKTEAEGRDSAGSELGSTQRSRAIAGLLLLTLSFFLLHCSSSESAPPEGGLAAILRHPDPLERVRWTAEFLEAADPDDLYEIQHVFETAPLARGDREYALFAHWWASFDPRAAYDSTFDSLRMEGGHVVRQIMRTWARNDPQAMEGYGLLWDRHTWGSTTPGLRPELVESVVIGWYESGKPGLEAWLSGLKDGASQSAGLKQYVTMKVMGEGNEETLRWALALDEAEGRSAIFGTALNVVAHEDPQLAIEWLDRAKELGADIQAATRRIANAWGHHDPPAAAAWLLSSETGMEQSRSLRAVARHWVRWDYEGFAAWLREREGEGRLDTMRTAFVTTGSKSRKFEVDWPRLLEVAEGITETPSRKRDVYWVLQRWYLVDEAAVLAWFEANPGSYPEKVKQHLGNIPEKESELIKAAFARQESSASAEASS
ncbi:MAG: hypothetical protein AAGC67_09880 [Myxococcota bacterium]